MPIHHRGRIRCSGPRYLLVKMQHLKSILITFTILTLCCQTQGADKYTDEKRPYEFGFKIDGEQHRHEKKDENGIIMGEFGFITADGVYHVTVYATDENGGFKILSMKNIRVKPYPTGTETKRGHSIPFPPSQKVPVIQGPQSLNQPNKINTSPVQFGIQGQSCSSCSLPTKSTKAPELTDLAVVSKDQPNSAYNPISFQSSQPDINPESPYYNQQGLGSVPKHPGIISGQEYSREGASRGLNYPQQEFLQPGPSVQNYGATDDQTQQNYPGQVSNMDKNSAVIETTGEQSNEARPNYPYEENSSGPNNPSDQRDHNKYASVPQYPDKNLQPPSAEGRNPKEYNIATPQLKSPNGDNQYFPQNRGEAGVLPGERSRPKKPTLISAQMRVVSKDTDIYHKEPGEKDGLPEGLTNNDMLRILYTFNYTVGFHGHHEVGYSNGVKVGYYYVTGRNGVKTRVDYVADEKGFRPKITQEILDLLSDEVPKPETEKDEKYGLKSYEFKWLYFPKDSKSK